MFFNFHSISLTVNGTRRISLLVFLNTSIHTSRTPSHTPKRHLLVSFRVQLYFKLSKGMDFRVHPQNGLFLFSYLRYLTNLHRKYVMRCTMHDTAGVVSTTTLTPPSLEMRDRVVSPPPNPSLARNARWRGLSLHHHHIPLLT